MHGVVDLQVRKRGRRSRYIGRMKTVDASLVSRVAAEHGTPCYLYDAAVIRDRISKLKSFDTLSQRHRLAELHRASKQEQREQDEQTSKSLAHNKASAEH